MAPGPIQKLPAEARSLTVMKFGGAALATPERVMRAARRIANRIRSGDLAIVVVSAMGDETDRLLALAGQILPGVTNHPELDTMLCAGEQIAAGLMAISLQAQGIACRSFLAHQIPIVTDGQAGDGQILQITSQKLFAALEAGVTPIVAGFQGVDVSSRLVTLGRGGSDTTAVAIAAAVGADYCEFFKDVDGVYSSDPALGPHSRRFEFLTYAEMESLAIGGAQVLHTKAVRMAAHLQVPLHVRSAFFEHEGTHIGRSAIHETQFQKEVCI